MRKIAIAGVVLLVLIAGLATFAATRLDEYITNNRAEISARASAALGREFAFESAAVSFRGGIGARLDGIRIADDRTFSSGDFVTADSVYVRVKLLPLLRRRIEAASIMLVRPVIELVQTKHGLNAAGLGAGPKAGDASAADGADSTAGAAAIAIALLNIAEGTIRYTDNTVSPPSVLTIENLAVEATDLDVTRPMSFSMTASVLGAERDNLQASGELGPLNADSPAATAIRASLKLSDVTIDELARAPAVANALPEGLRVTGPIDLALEIDGSASAAKVAARVDAARAAVNYAAAFAKPTGVPFSFSAQARRSNETITIDESSLVLNRAVVNTTGTVKTAGSDTAYDLAIRAPAIDLEGWDKILAALAGTAVSGAGAIDLRAQGRSGSAEPPSVTGTVAVTRMNASGTGRPALQDLTAKLTFKGRSASLAPTEFKIAGSPVRLQADIDDLVTLASRFTLTSPALDPAGLGFGDDDPKTKEILNDLSVKGSLRNSPSQQVDATVSASSGSLRGAAFRDLVATMRYADGRARFEPVQMLAFGGRLEGTAGYTARADGGAPAFEFDGKVRQVRLPELFAYAGLPASEQLLDGLFDAEFAVRGKGATWDVIRSALTGNGRMEIKKGTLKDFNIAEAVLGGLTGVPGLSNSLSPSLRSKYPALFASKNTVFKDLSSGVKLVNGVLHSDEFTLNADDFGLRGRGGYGLDRSVDFDAVFLASKELSADLVAESSILKYLTNQAGRLELPFDLKGTAPRIRAKLDSRFVARAVEKAAAGAVADLLGGLLGRRHRQAPTPPTPSPAPVAP